MAITSSAPPSPPELDELDALEEELLDAELLDELLEVELLVEELDAALLPGLPPQADKARKIPSAQLCFRMVFISTPMRYLCYRVRRLAT